MSSADMNMRSCLGLDFSLEYVISIRTDGSLYWREDIDEPDLVSMKHWRIARDEFPKDDPQLWESWGTGMDLGEAMCKYNLELRARIYPNEFEGSGFCCQMFQMRNDDYQFQPYDYFYTLIINTESLNPDLEEPFTYTQTYYTEDLCDGCEATAEQRIEVERTALYGAIAYDAAQTAEIFAQFPEEESTAINLFIGYAFISVLATLFSL